MKLHPLALLLGLATAVAPAHAIISTSDSSNWTTSSLSSISLASSALNGVANLTLSRSDGTFGCSGSLLAGGAYVLTAAHCVTSSTGTLNTSAINLSFGNGAATASVSSSSQIQVFSGWSGTSSLGESSDLALLRLDTAVTSVTGYSLYNADPLGQTVLLAGYGLTGVGNSTTRSSTSALHWGLNQYEATIVPSSGDDGAYVYDFDTGLSTNNALTRTYGLSSSLGLGSFEASIASGDSGGGSFVMGAGGTLYLAGVHSFGYSTGTSGGDLDNTTNFTYGELAGDATLWGDGLSWVNSVVYASAVPEPASWALTLAGLAALGRRGRQQHRRQSRQQGRFAAQ